MGSSRKPEQTPDLDDARLRPWQHEVVLHAPLRRKLASERSALQWSIAIVLSLVIAVIVAILVLRPQPSDSTAGPLNASAVAGEDVAYVYRCADGSVRGEPCEAPKPEIDPPDTSTAFTLYSEPQWAHDPTARRLLADADARYRRQVESAKRSPSPYEETVAVTQSSSCRALRRDRDQIRVAMRGGYGAELGERYRKRDLELWRAGVRLGCWTGTTPPG